MSTNKKNSYNKEIYRNFALVTQLGISMMVPVFLTLAIGLYIEKRTDLFVTVPLLVLGFLAGFRNVYIIVIKSTKKSDREKEIEEERRLVNEAVKKWNQDK